MKNKESWASIDGVYEVSSLGRVRSIDRMVSSRNGSQRRQFARIIKTPPDSNGYPSFNICHEGTCKRVKVHRLVAKYFLNAKGKNLVVNHIDGDKQNNKYENLEYVTQRENVVKHYSTKKTLPVGIASTKHGTFKATVWRGSKPVLSKCYKSLDRAIFAREEFLSKLTDP